MIARSFFCFAVHRNLFLQTLTHFRSNFSILAESNVINSNAPSQNLFLHFITNRFNISSADAAKMVKREPTLGRLKTLDKVEQLVYMFSRHGCTEDQIAFIIRTQPSLLTTSAERVVEPKIQVLKDFGVWTENLTKIVTRLPWILNTKVEILRSNLGLLMTVFPTQDMLIRAIKSNALIVSKRLQETLKPLVAFWEDFGFCGTELTLFLLVNPCVLMCNSLTLEKRDLIRKISIHKKNNMYKYAVSMVAMNRIEVLEARIHNFQLCGLSPEEALQVVRADPLVLNMSNENIKKKMYFILNHMELSVDFVVKHPRMFTMSLDRVMRPRFSVLQGITAMDAAEKVNPTRLLTILKMTEAKFVGQIIEGHPESAALWTVYKNAIANVSKAQR